MLLNTFIIKNVITTSLSHHIYFIIEGVETAEASEEKTIGFLKCFSYRQTWSFIVGKLMTDGVWWFFLFWAPAYFSDQYGYSSDSGMGIALIFTLYAIVTLD